MNNKYKFTQIEHFQCKAIKKGDTLFLPVTYDCLLDGGQVSVDTPAGYKHFSCFSFIIPEAAPKYDPNRKFRKGDKAKPRTINGREIPKMPLDVIFTVTGDEDEYGAVPVEYMSPVRGLLTSTTVHAVWLELVTPVEELDPFYIERQGEKTGGLCFTVRKRNGYAEATFYFGACRSRDEQHAKEAAEAERDRLNAEFRKEQE